MRPDIDAHDMGNTLSTNGNYASSTPGKASFGEVHEGPTSLEHVKGNMKTVCFLIKHSLTRAMLPRIRWWQMEIKDFGYSIEYSYPSLSKNALNEKESNEDPKHSGRRPYRSTARPNIHQRPSIIIGQQ